MTELDDRRAGQVLEQLDSLFVALCVTQRRLLACVREWDLGERWLDDGCRDMAQWLSGRFGMSHFIARRWVHAAHALERLPLISAALEDGVVGLDKVLELTRFATAESEAVLITWARRVSVAAVRNRAEVAAQRDIVEARSHDSHRSLRWCFNDGRMGLFGEFPAAQGSAIANAIARIAERLPELPPDLSYEGVSDSAEAVVSNAGLTPCGPSPRRGWPRTPMPTAPRSWSTRRWAPPARCHRRVPRCPGPRWPIPRCPTRRCSRSRS